MHQKKTMRRKTTDDPEKRLWKKKSLKSIMTRRTNSRGRDIMERGARGAHLLDQKAIFQQRGVAK